MRVLLAGFGPFPGAPLNPSAAVAQALARRRRPALADLDRSLHVFPTAYAAVDHDLPKLFADKPDIILIFGLAGRRRQICIETRAADVHRPALLRPAEQRRSLAARRSTICCARHARTTCPSGCRAMPGAICAITFTGTR